MPTRLSNIPIFPLCYTVKLLYRMSINKRDTQTGLNPPKLFVSIAAKITMLCGRKRKLLIMRTFKVENKV